MACSVYGIKPEKSVELVCRLCFIERDNYRMIFEDGCSSLVERIENLTSLKIINFPNAPASLCFECDTTLQNFDSFRDMCLTNDRVIRETFSHYDLKNSQGPVSGDMPIIRKIDTDQTENLTSCLGSSNDPQSHNDEITIEYQDIKVEEVCARDSNIIDNEKLNHKPEKLLKHKKGKSRLDTEVKKMERHICNLCDKGFTTGQRLRVHIRSHSQERPYKCKACGKSFITHSSLNIHMRTHSGLKPYSCDRCQSKFAQKSHLIRHEQGHLKKELLRTNNHTEENEHEEDLQDVEKNDSFLEPMRANSDRKEHCKICNKYVTQLSSHQDIHLVKRRYQCEYCPKGFSQHNKLVTHIRTHTKEKPYVCSLCGKAFPSTCTYKVHIRSHTQERPYKCKECKKAFITASHLKRHKQTHSGLKPYSCDVCEAKFSQKAHLLRHNQVQRKLLPTPQLLWIQLDQIVMPKKIRNTHRVI